MTYRILVINPNSTEAVTDAISRSAQPHRQGDCTIDCHTLAEGPPGIVTQFDKASVVAPMKSVLAKESPTTDAFIIACYGDPGLQAMRDATTKPVFGIGEISFYAAMALGDQFGIISTNQQACQRHIRYARELGISSRLAGDLSIEIPILELDTHPDKTLQRAIEVGKELQHRGATSLVTGCAGLADFQMALQSALGISVVEPVSVTVGLACAVVRSRLTSTPAC